MSPDAGRSALPAEEPAREGVDHDGGFGTVGVLPGRDQQTGIGTARASDGRRYSTMANSGQTS